MKALLAGEFRDGKVLPSTYELYAFAEKIGATASMVMVGDENVLPVFDGKLYIASIGKGGGYAPDIHKKIIGEAVEIDKPDLIVFSHSSYGCDMAPRIAFSLKAALVSEVVDLENEKFIVPSCNGKLRRELLSKTPATVLTLQPGAFTPTEKPEGTPEIVRLDYDDSASMYTFCGFEAPESTGVDLAKAAVIVVAGRGVGKEEGIANINNLAEILGGETGATRPVVDAGWLPKERQVGASGVTVTPKLYIGCGVSGAVQHLAGMRKSEFIVAINTDPDAPVGEVADVIVIADVKEFLPALVEKIKEVKG